MRTLSSGRVWQILTLKVILYSLMLRKHVTDFIRMSTSLVKDLIEKSPFQKRFHFKKKKILDYKFYITEISTLKINMYFVF